MRVVVEFVIIQQSDLAAATQFHNTVKDLLGLLQLMRIGASSELTRCLTVNANRAPLLPV